MGLLVKERLLCKEKSASLFALKVFLKARESTESSEYKSLQLNTYKFFLACYKLSRIEAISKSHLPLIQWQTGARRVQTLHLHEAQRLGFQR